MKKHLLSLIILIIFSPLCFGQYEGRFIELPKILKTNGTKSQAKIFIAPKSKDNDMLRNQFFDYESIKIDGLIEPASDDAGKQIDIFVVVRKQTGAKKTFYALNEDGVWVTWNGSLKTLPVFKSIGSASDKHEFTAYSGAIESDEFNMYIGYSSETVNGKPIIHVNQTPYKIKAVDENSTKYVSNLSFLNRRTPVWVDLTKIRDPAIVARNMQEFQEDRNRAPLAWSFLDIDLDGDDDIFQATYWYGNPYTFNNVKRVPAELYINDGANKFSYSEEYFTNEIPSFVHPRKSIVADFNSDTYPDIFIVDHGYDQNPFPGSTNWLVISDGNGKYVSKELTERSEFFHGAAAGDLDGDLDIDIFDSRGYFYINDGKGNFSVSKSDLNTYQRYTVEIFDLNNDGYNEIIVSGHVWENPTTIYLGNEDHVYSEDNKIIIEPLNDVWGVVVDILIDDFDSDGNYEILLSTTKGPDKFYEGFAVQLVSLGTNLEIENSKVIYMDGGKNWVEWLRVTDYDNDGDKDILSDDKGSDYAKPLLLLNDGNQNFSRVRL
jgi:hypothetical protein